MNFEAIRRFLLAGLLTAALIASAAIPATASAAFVAWRCLSPGVTWAWLDDPQAVTVEISWFDAAGTLIATTTVPTSGPSPVFVEKTPDGAVEAGFSWIDASGTEFAVGGGTCSPNRP
jgi:hypothetical protein